MTPADGSPSPREPLWLLAILATALLAGRLLAAGYGGFFENDSISLAAGVAAILRDSSGDIYRYGPQVGYYHLVAALGRLAGGDVLLIPPIQVTLSVLAGTAIPMLGLAAFRNDLTRQERWLVAGTLAANPILWMASRYGSSAMVSTTLAFAGLVILSNRPRRRGELAALALVAAAILVRADAVLATAGVALLLWRNHGAIRPAAIRFAGLGLSVAAVFALLFVVDPRTRSLAGDVALHLDSPTQTMFWDYLLWSVSPIPLFFAVVGVRELLPTRAWVAAVLGAWSLPIMAFYYTATTQPRYFLLMTLPIALAAAVGMAGMARMAGRWSRVALAGIIGLCCLHLLVGMGRYSPQSRRSYLIDASVPTHTGPLWTGALLWKSYWSDDLRNAPVFHPWFGNGNAVDGSATRFWAHLASGAERNQHLVLVLREGYGHVAQFFGQAAGAELSARAPGVLWYAPTEWRLGGARLTTIGIPQFQRDSVLSLPVAAGDGLWFFDHLEAPVHLVRDRLPPGLDLEPGPALPGAPRIYRYRVVPAP